MPFRVSILDLTAAIIVLVAIVLPERSSTVAVAFRATDEQQRAMALYQAQAAAAPDDAEAAARLSALLSDVGQTDWAIQVAGEAAARTSSWRALLAVSLAHAERVEVQLAYRYAEQALEQCHQSGPEICPGHQEVRLAMYHDQLEAGVKSGIDPRLDPTGYENEVLRNTRMIHFRGATPDVENLAPRGGGHVASKGRVSAGGS